MIKKQEIKDFKKKLEKSRDEYCKMINEKESSKMSYSDEVTVSIWDGRINALNKMIDELDILELELFV